MASFKLGLYLLVSVFAFIRLPSPVICDDDEEPDLIHDINIYRQTLNLPVLKELDTASCLADEIADDLEDKPCEEFRDYYPVPGSNPKLPNFRKHVEKCKININTTRDGVIMPVCVPNLDSNAVFSNYTKSNRYTKYLNNSKYTVVGVGSKEESWMVLILSTNTSSGDFSSATSLLAEAWKGHYLVVAFFSALVVLLVN